MSSDIAKKVRANPKFAELVHRRTKLATTLTIAMLVVYYGFVLLVAYAKPFLATPIGAGLTTIGVTLGVGVILAAFVLTGIYVAKANKDFDTLTAQIVEETK